MKRLALIALGVLVPFGALVAWGLFGLREPAPAVLAPVAAVDPPGPAPAPAPAPAAVAVPAPVAAAAQVQGAAPVPAVAPSPPVPVVAPVDDEVADDPAV